MFYFLGIVAATIFYTASAAIPPSSLDTPGPRITHYLATVIHKINGHEENFWCKAIIVAPKLVLAHKWCYKKYDFHTLYIRTHLIKDENLEYDIKPIDVAENGKFVLFVLPNPLVTVNFTIADTLNNRPKYGTEVIAMGWDGARLDVERKYKIAQCRRFDCLYGDWEWICDRWVGFPVLSRHSGGDTLLGLMRGENDTVDRDQPGTGDYRKCCGPNSDTCHYGLKGIDYIDKKWIDRVANSLEGNNTYYRAKVMRRRNCSDWERKCWATIVTPNLLLAPAWCYDNRTFSTLYIKTHLTEDVNFSRFIKPIDVKFGPNEKYLLFVVQDALITANFTVADTLNYPPDEGTKVFCKRAGGEYEYKLWKCKSLPLCIDRDGSCPSDNGYPVVTRLKGKNTLVGLLTGDNYTSCAEGAAGMDFIDKKWIESVANSL